MVTVPQSTPVGGLTPLGRVFTGTDQIPVLPLNGALLLCGTVSELQSYLTTTLGGLSVTQFGATGNGTTDDSAAFQAAATAAGTGTSIIQVPVGNYLINTAPTWGAKSIYWQIDVEATFTGAATTGATGFPRAATNSLLAAGGPFIQSQTGTIIDGGLGGPAAFTVEMLQPSTCNGINVAIYPGASGSSASGDVWAVNPLVTANAGAGGIYQALEVDVNNYSGNTNCLTIGVSVNGDGNTQQFAAYSAQSGTPLTSNWNYGLLLQNCVEGVSLNMANVTYGLTTFTAAAKTVGPIPILIDQSLNGKDTIFVLRHTDTSPTGRFICFTNAAGSTVLFSVDASGNVYTAAGLTVAGTIGGVAGSFSGTVGANLLVSSTDVDATVNVNAGGWVRTGSKTVATLPAPATAGASARMFVTDSTVVAAGNFGATVAGGGANFVPVWTDGATWKIG